MAAAARIGDATNHPGSILGPGAVTVLIENRPAAVMGTMHSCALPPNAGPHSPTPLQVGSRTVFINGRPAARVGDKAGCGAVIITGAARVEIGG